MTRETKTQTTQPIRNMLKFYESYRKSEAGRLAIRRGTAFAKAFEAMYEKATVPA